MFGVWEDNIECHDNKTQLQRAVRSLSSEFVWNNLLVKACKLAYNRFPSVNCAWYSERRVTM